MENKTFEIPAIRIQIYSSTHTQVDQSQLFNDYITFHGRKYF